MIRPLLCLAAAVLAAYPAAAADETLRIGMGFLSFRRGDPYQGITLPSVMAHQAVYDTLTTIGEKGEVLPALAVSWKAQDPKTWVLTLRQGVAFSNGEPLTADALVVSAAYMNTPKGRSETIGSTLYQVDRAEKVDDLTVRVHLNEADALFPLHVSAWRIPAPNAFTNLGADGFKDNPIGTGPFTVTSWTEGRVVMAANPNSWRAPKVAGLEIREIPEETARLQALVSGAIDFALGLSLEHESSLREVGATLVNRLTPTVSFLAVNTAMVPNSPLKDPRVRQALNYAVDRQTIIDQVLGGSTDAAAQLTFPGAFGYDSTLKPYPYDPVKARELLAAAGYKDGLKLQAGVAVGARASDTLYYQQIAADLQNVGIDLELVPRPQMTQMQDLFFGKLTVDMFTMFTRGFDALADYRHRTCAGLTQGRAAFHCDPIVMPALQAALAENNAAKREAQYRQVAQLERENPPGIMLWQGMEFDGVARGVTGYAPVFEDVRLHLIEKKKK
ncbi:MAG: ABC transporter substrate-binding protein [Rhodospirillaceae bacterium]|nr:ABC transporter substrate-binding protein [Rhodospirillaceae bacterium]